MLLEFCYNFHDFLFITILYFYIFYIIFSENSGILMLYREGLSWLEWTDIVRFVAITVTLFATLYFSRLGAMRYCDNINQQIEECVENGYKLYFEGSEIDYPIKITANDNYRFEIYDDEKVVCFSGTRHNNYIPIVISH